MPLRPPRSPLYPYTTLFRSRQLERAREEALAASRDAARAQERARIGREIHDAVGHHATLIAVGAAAIAASTAEEETRRGAERSEEHTSELQSQSNLVCRLLL